MKIFGFDLRGNITIGENNVYHIGDSTHRMGTLHAVEFNGLATSSQYADLAECYIIDNSCEAGDVVLFDVDGINDGIKSNKLASNKVLGVVSSKPGFLLDRDLESGTPIALTGKVKCKVIGSVVKGDRLISSEDGCAVVAHNSEGQTIGFSLQTNLINEIKQVLIKV